MEEWFLAVNKPPALPFPHSETSVASTAMGWGNRCFLACFALGLVQPGLLLYGLILLTALADPVFRRDGTGRR